jgi:hypothetical protein
MPVVSPLAGLVIVSSSPRWTSAQKSAAWVLAAGGAVAGLFFFVLAAAITADAGVGLVLAYLAMVTGSVIAGLALIPGLAARRRTVP